MKLASRLSSFLSVLALSVSTVCLAPSVARATEQVPFRAAYDTEFALTVNFPIGSVAVIGSGLGTHLGAFVLANTSQTVNLLTGDAVARYEFTAPNGDVLVANFQFIAVPTPTGFVFNGVWQADGGTGRFVGATGAGWVDGRADFTGPGVGIGHVEMGGTISSPGSLK